MRTSNEVYVITVAITKNPILSDKTSCKKVRSSSCTQLIKHYAMKAYGGVVV
jgi:hypothetical protein